MEADQLFVSQIKPSQQSHQRYVSIRFKEIIMPRKSSAKPAEKVNGVVEPAKNIKRGFCALREMPQRQFSPDVSHERAQLIILLSNKWVNGTVLHYYFFDKPSDQTAVVLGNG